MDEPQRNVLRKTVTKCRKLLEEAIGEILQGQFGIHPNGKIDDAIRMGHLTESDQEYREQVLVHLHHIQAGGYKPTDAVAQLIREVAFTHLNRFFAYKLLEQRKLIREAVSRGINSNGFKFYLADHPEDEKLWSSGKQDIAYRHFLEWLGGTLTEEIGVLFSPHDPANRLFPPQRTLDQVLGLINSDELKEIWNDEEGLDEVVGWVYQYFTPKELRDQARKESGAPRNSYEMAFRNQFYTPRYVVQFLVDNTLGRIWYEMRKGDTALKEKCRYLVRRPTEVFLSSGEIPPQADGGNSSLSQEELLKQPVYIPHRAKKDPREIKILDPASGSGHFLLYCFDLLEVIYAEAYEDDQLGAVLKQDYPTLMDLKRAVPELILSRNLHGIDIDPRATQIAALALWLRTQRTYQEIGLKKDERPRINRTNMVCAEPMPGEKKLLEEFSASLEPKVLGQLVRVVFDRMKLAGEAGSLLKIEEEIKDEIAKAKKQWLAGPKPEQLTLFPKQNRPREQLSFFDLSGITDEQFWNEAEARLLEALRGYATQAANGGQLLRQLFSDDAARGFALVDISRKRFDVVLMNPPFGEAVETCRKLFAVTYPTWNKNLLCAFIERGLDLLTNTGMLGAIFDRTAAVKSTYEEFRTSVMLSMDRPTACADLGWEVLDANVETTSLTWQQRSNATSDKCVFFDVRRITPDDKGGELLNLIEGRKPTSTKNVQIASTELLSLPNAVMGYDMPLFLIHAISHYPSLKDSGLQAYTGAQIRSEQHFRVFWECPSDREFTPDSDYCHMYNGGEYIRFFMPPRDVALYGKGGKNIDESDLSYSWRVQSRHAYFKSGIGFGVRGEFLDAHYLREGYLFTVEGQNAPSEKDHLKWFALGLLNSAAYQVALNSYCGQHKYSGYVNLLPLPTNENNQEGKVVRETARRSFEILESWHSYDQTTLIFCGIPYLLRFGCQSNLGDQLRLYFAAISELRNELADLYRRLNNAVQSILKIAPEESVVVEDVRAKLDGLFPYTLDEKECLADLLSYMLGAVFGYWDVRIVINPHRKASLPDPPAGYPHYPPASFANTLHEASKIERTEYEQYLLDVDWDGILVDDPDHKDDIISRVRGVFELLWQQEAVEIERQACEYLGIKDLRESFRRPGNDGFWMYHIKQYSKSRRKAPIYWLLQSSKKNYGLWLYYHRLDKDMLFKALINYVEPKIRLEENLLDQVRSRRAAAGTGGREVKQLEKQIDQQESFLSELRDFGDKLRRAADLRLEPDLNDGVVLNIAPLWELVPWTEAKKYWQELLEGKYEWSSIGKQLREKGMVKA